MARETNWGHWCWIFPSVVSSFEADQNVAWKHSVVNRSDYQSSLLHSEWLEYKTATTGTKSAATTGQGSDRTFFKKLHLVFPCTALWMDDVLGWELPKRLCPVHRPSPYKNKFKPQTWKESRTWRYLWWGSKEREEFYFVLPYRALGFFLDKVNSSIVIKVMEAQYTMPC